MSNLTDEQKAQIARWVEEGADLNALQDRIRSEFEMTLSFMDTRFLISDLGLEIKEEEEPPEEADPAGTGDEEPTGEADGSDKTAGGSGSVTVTMDSLCRPGMVASGQVTFSDGKKAGWYFDEMGRLGIDPDEPGYRPTEEDVIAFQDELQRVAAKAGL